MAKSSQSPIIVGERNAQPLPVFTRKLLLGGNIGMRISDMFEIQNSGVTQEENSGFLSLAFHISPRIQLLAAINSSALRKST